MGGWYKTSFFLLSGRRKNIGNVHCLFIFVDSPFYHQRLTAPQFGSGWKFAYLLQNLMMLSGSHRAMRRSAPKISADSG